MPTPSPTELTRNNSIEDGRAEPKAKACHLLQEALRLVEEARESYPGFDYTAATQNLEALAADKTPTQDPQNLNRTPDCCNALQELASLRKEVQELKELLTLTTKLIDSTPKGNTYSEALGKGQATTVTCSDDDLMANWFTNLEVSASDMLQSALASFVLSSMSGAYVCVQS